MLTVEQRIENEKRILRKLFEMAEAAGFRATHVDDGEELVRCTSNEEILENVFAVDESSIVFKGPIKSRSVFVILGNGNDGYDLISDYSYSEGDPDGFDALMHAHMDWMEAEQQYPFASGYNAALNEVLRQLDANPDISAAGHAGYIRANLLKGGAA